MSTPLCAVENYCNARQFSGHTISGDEEAPNFEAWHIADGRRSIFDYWTAITPNAQHILTFDFGGVSRPMNCAFIDRGHNFGGVQVFWEYWTGAAWAALLSPTISATTTTDLTNSNGATTEEGAWGAYFASQSATKARLRIPALGTGVLPKVVGCWLGRAYEPGPLLMPWSEDQNTLRAQRIVTPSGWEGRGRAASTREGALNIRLNQESDYATARYHVHQLYGGNLPGLRDECQPMWICYDRTQADRAFLAMRPEGELAFRMEPATGFPRRAAVAYREHERASS